MKAFKLQLIVAVCFFVQACSDGAGKATSPKPDESANPNSTADPINPTTPDLTKTTISDFMGLGNKGRDYTRLDNDDNHSWACFFYTTNENLIDSVIYSFNSDNGSSRASGRNSRNFTYNLTNENALTLVFDNNDEAEVLSNLLVIDDNIFTASSSEYGNVLCSLQQINPLKLVQPFILSSLPSSNAGSFSKVLALNCSSGSGVEYTQITYNILVTLADISSNKTGPFQPVLMGSTAGQALVILFDDQFEVWDNVFIEPDLSGFSASSSLRGELFCKVTDRFLL